MIDANQRWDVAEAISWVSRLAEFKPLWIEEPTCPDDILGHAAIAKVHQQLFCSCWEYLADWVSSSHFVPYAIFLITLFSNYIRPLNSFALFFPLKGLIYSQYVDSLTFNCPEHVNMLYFFLFISTNIYFFYYLICFKNIIVNLFTLYSLLL